MSILVTFLVINKLSYTMGLYYEMQGSLAKMNQSAVDLVQLACSFTTRLNNRSGECGGVVVGKDDEENRTQRSWRSKVAYQTLLLLKATTCVIWKNGNQENWADMPELRDDPPVLFLPLGTGTRNTGGDGELKDHNNQSNFGRRGRHSFKRSSENDGRHYVPKELYVWGQNLQSDRNLRLPIRMAQRLREAITDQHLDSIREQQLLDCVKEFVSSYYGIRKYLTCPLPFPLVQLGRLFVIFYVFTLPFALLSPGLGLKFGQMIVLIVFMTYGFMGIELLYVEIDDPFADEPNDLPLMEEARTAGEDILLSLMRVDGQDAANNVNNKFSRQVDLVGGVGNEKNQQSRTQDSRFWGGAGGYDKETDPLV